MIIICLGNVGSGKTASTVYEMLRYHHKKFYSNILTKKIPNNVPIDPSMIIKKEIVGEKKKRDGTIENIYERKLNVEYWQSIPEAINVVLDEAHTILNSRRSMSKTNIILTDWMALIRRVLGSQTGDQGTLYLITQLSGRIDTIARDMANEIRWHKCHYNKRCLKKSCGYVWRENSDMPNQRYFCPRCEGFKLKKENFKIEVKAFASMRHFEMGMKPFKWYIIRDIEKVFPMYNTLQWDNLFGGNY